MKNTLLLILFFFSSISFAQNYHADDKAALRSFLRQESAEEGKANLEQLGLMPADTLNWLTDEAWISSLLRVTWSDETPQRITRILWGRKNISGKLDMTSCAELANLYCYENSISSLNVASCKKLRVLDCADNFISSLDASSCTELVVLDCYNNALFSLDISFCTGLTHLDCSNNSISSLDVSSCTKLARLNCLGNTLSSLDISSCTELLYLDCSFNNNISSLDISSCTKLTHLDCLGNTLSSLDISSCTELLYLDCSLNNISSLDISSCTKLTQLKFSSNNIPSPDLSSCPELTHLGCSGNNLFSLDVSFCPKLTHLDSFNNNLSSLDVSSCPGLTYLSCSSNNLSSLDLSPCPELTSLDCSYNNLSSLDMSFCPNLTSLSCSNNIISYLDIHPDIELVYFNCYSNRLLLSKLYEVNMTVTDIGKRYLNPQHIPYQNAISIGTPLDFSSEKIFDDVKTIYRIRRMNRESLEEGIHYTISDGVIVFLEAGEFRVDMTNAAIQDTYGLVEVVVYGITVEDESVSIPEVKMNSKVAVYPNPIYANETLIVKLPKELEGSSLEVYTMSGMLVKQRISLSNELNNVDISGLSPSTYLFHIISKEGRRETFTVIIK